GLPPGPIASPGLKSIMAVLEPADVDYLYFVAKNDGTHVFSRTFEEHVAARRALGY
ncbi:MAG: endolytic transglycosylase MltG, partial [Limnochordia bacterium]